MMTPREPDGPSDTESPVAALDGEASQDGVVEDRPADTVDAALEECRSAQLRDELECAYRRMAQLRDEIEQLSGHLSPEQCVELLERFIEWRSGAHRPSRRERLSLLLRSGGEGHEPVEGLVAEISASEWFDAEWYTATYPPVAGLRISPQEHYLRYGAAEGKDPSPRFSTLAYLVRYPDVALSGMNPLVHYLRHGLEEGRSPAPP